MERTRRYYEAQGFTKPYVWAHFDEVPFTRVVKPLADSTLVLITTAAPYNRQAGDAREVLSGSAVTPPTCLYGNDLSWDKQATHLEDLNSYFPIDHLKTCVDDGHLGSVAPRFHSLPTEYSQRQTLQSDAPEILARCQEDGVDVAMLVPL